MVDSPTKTRPQDAQRVNVNQEYELRYWTEKFGVSADRLRSAVERVGPMAEDVANELRWKKAGT